MLQYVNLAFWRTAHSSYKSTKFCLPVCHPSAYITKAFLGLINTISNTQHSKKRHNLHFRSLFLTKYLPCVCLIPASLFCCFLSRLEILRQTKWQKLHVGTGCTYLVVNKKKMLQNYQRWQLLIFPSNCLSHCLSNSLSDCLTTRLLNCLLNYLCNCLANRPPNCLSVCLNVCLPALSKCL